MFQQKRQEGTEVYKVTEKNNSKRKVSTLMITKDIVSQKFRTKFSLLNEMGKQQIIGTRNEKSTKTP